MRIRDIFQKHVSDHKLLNCSVCLYLCKPFSFTDKWEIHPDELILREELGSGQFGLVLKGSFHDRQVAVKTLREGFMSEEEFKEEAQVMM